MTLAGAIFIDRGNSKGAQKSLQKAGDDLKEKEVRWPFIYYSSMPIPNLDRLRLAINLDVPRGHADSLPDP